MVKKILSIMVWTASVLGLLVLFAFARHNYLNSPVSGIDIKLVRNSQSGFLAHSDLMERLIVLTDSASGKAIRKLKMQQIKTDMEQNPWIDKVDISTTLDGMLSMRVNEREACLRVYNRKNESVYIDKKGILFPINPAYASRVLIASGYLDFPIPSGRKTASIFDSVYRKTMLPEIFYLNKAIQADPFLVVLIDQIYYNSLNEIELSPKIGSASVLLGDTENLSKKLLYLKAFYKQKALSDELIQYKRINLKFKNQIVCTKR